MYNIKEILENKKLLDLVAKQFFEAIDIDNSGRLSEDELHTILQNLSDNFGFERPTVAETQKILELVDFDRSGYIDVSEFRKMLKKILLAIRDDYTNMKKKRKGGDDEDEDEFDDEVDY